MSKKENRLSENALVQKSNPLFSLQKEKEKINLFEYKMLDLYLARINSHDPNNRIVHVSENDLNEVLPSHLAKAELHKKLKKLQGLVVSYGEDEAITLFEYSKITVNEHEFDIQLMCTNTALKYFFNIENIGYFKYKFKNTLAISSMYSYLLFNFLEMNRFREQPILVELQELKNILNCNSPSYNDYKRFSYIILKKCYKELTEKTELKYTYTPVRVGKKVTHISFDIKPLDQQMLSELQLSDPPATITAEELHEEPDEKEEVILSEAIVEQVQKEQRTLNLPSEETEELDALFMTACDESFSPLEMKILVSSIKPEILEEYNIEQGYGIAVYNYLEKMYNLLLVQEQESNITNRFKYFKAMLQNDTVTKKTSKDETADIDKYNAFINKF